MIMSFRRPLAGCPHSISRDSIKYEEVKVKVKMGVKVEVKIGVKVGVKVEVTMGVKVEVVR